MSEEIFEPVFEEPKSKVYIQVDDNNRVTRVEGGYTTPADLTGWIEVDEGYGDKYNLCQSHYLEKGLFTEDGFYQYKFKDNAVVERTAEEIEGDRVAVPETVSELEKLQAQVLYTAVVTDTLLEEE